MSADLFTETSEIVAGIAALNPLATEDDGYYKSCFLCGATEWVDVGEGTDVVWIITDHEPDCVWIRARRITQRPVHPHRVR